MTDWQINLYLVQMHGTRHPWCLGKSGDTGPSRLASYHTSTMDFQSNFKLPHDWSNYILRLGKNSSNLEFYQSGDPTEENSNGILKERLKPQVSGDQTSKMLLKSLTYRRQWVTNSWELWSRRINTHLQSITIKKDVLLTSTFDEF